MSLKRKSMDLTSACADAFYSCAYQNEEGARKIGRFDSNNRYYQQMSDVHTSNSPEPNCGFSQQAFQQSQHMHMEYSLSAVPQHRFITSSCSY
ncbi:hypothetical protein SARC_04856 [Sphaeroforma arctica JP610]|uniref:Uncharacterized protein n=1 Tax=Sphaeroforma arctica JP610 TaxID=667725 RepID=A0A0L0G1Z8_9EUKA|nr:hypothetical protein SARC_04856 [Sphaeroforma arctica JP610]KNC82856.1 hypothetical protein SARC_04856 [Sphaeroforma arctica JP610]|eukprot:XP_014156758.1 hypothetical protein SARC_04856 [Sphaeroforma arctica JP610]